MGLLSLRSYRGEILKHNYEGGRPGEHIVRSLHLNLRDRDCAVREGYAESHVNV